MVDKAGNVGSDFFFFYQPFVRQQQWCTGRSPFRLFLKIRIFLSMKFRGPDSAPLTYKDCQFDSF